MLICDAEAEICVEPLGEELLVSGGGSVELGPMLVCDADADTWAELLSEEVRAVLKSSEDPCDDCEEAAPALEV